MLRLELVNISKQYPAVKANDSVNLKVEPGQLAQKPAPQGPGAIVLAGNR